jgi:hypothetical protein
VAVQPLGDHLGVALGERVDDAGARQLREVGRQPGEPVGLGGELDDLEAQARAAERPAVGAQRGGAADLQLLLDVGPRNCGLLSRSGLMRRTSTASCARRSRTSAQASRLVELIVWARIPSRSAAAIWLRISASSGETISAGPAPRSRSSAVAMK